MAYETNQPESTRSGEPPLVGEAKARAADLGRRASNMAEQARTAAAGGLESAANAMHDRTDRVAGAAHNAADALSSGAEYLRANDLRQMADDIVAVIRNNPGTALLGAAALGFLIGRAVSRD